MSTYQPIGKFYTSTERKVYFGDTDAAGVAHHSMYIRWFEAGRIDFLDDIGCPYHELQSEHIGFVPVHIDVSYKQPLVFGDKYRIKTAPLSFKKASFTIKAEIISEKGIHAQCTVKLACMNESTWKITPVPHFVIDKVKAFEEA
jgi:acyl-CoA thioester hydrolase